MSKISKTLFLAKGRLLEVDEYIKQEGFLEPEDYDRLTVLEKIKYEEYCKEVVDGKQSNGINYRCDNRSCCSDWLFL